jgi:hypothetical protein
VSLESRFAVFVAAIMSLFSALVKRQMSTEPRPKKLLDHVRDEIERKHYSPRADEGYANWIKRFIRSQQPKTVRHGKPEELRLVTRRDWLEPASR